MHRTAPGLARSVSWTLFGVSVVVAPRAFFHHAVAMATGRREGARRETIRYFTRRNRLRTIAKNASTARVMESRSVTSPASVRRAGPSPAMLRTDGDVLQLGRIGQRQPSVPERIVALPRDEVEAVGNVETREPEDGTDALDLLGRERPNRPGSGTHVARVSGRPALADRPLHRLRTGIRVQRLVGRQRSTPVPTCPNPW